MGCWWQVEVVVGGIGLLAVVVVVVVSVGGGEW